MEKKLIEEFDKLPIQEDVKRHSNRVMELSLQIANKLIETGYDELINMSDLKVAAQYHDVGKKDVSKFILNKPGKLLDHEYQQMQMHVKYSGRYASDRGFSSNIIKIILHHHETCNGKGYPFGLKSDALSIETKILRVADVYDALTNDRPYREAYNQNDALDLILRDHEEYDIEILKVLFEVLGIRNIDSEQIA